MKIYLDGVDCAGKTTLTTYLSQRFKIDKFTLTKDSEKSIRRYLDLNNIDNVVVDRTFLSEVIYPQIFGRQSILSDSDVEYLINIYNKDIFIILTADDDDLIKRINERGDEFEEIIKQLITINHSYLDIANRYNLLVLNTSKLNNQQIGDIIERRLNDEGYCSK